MVDINMVEDLITHLRAEYLPIDMPSLLAQSEFERGRAAMVFEIIDRYERLLTNGATDDES